MAGFVKLGLKILTKAGPPVVKQTIRRGTSAVKYAGGTAREFTSGLVKGRGTYTTLEGGGAVRVSTIYPSTRIGIQTRQAAIGAVRAVAVRTPKATLAAVKYAVRSTVRDTMVGHAGAVQTYQFLRVNRLMQGRTSKVERALDAYVVRSGRLLDKVGLAPSIPGTAVSLGRIAAVGTVVAGYEVAHDRIAAARGQLESLFTQYQTVRQTVDAATRGETVPAPAPPVRLPTPTATVPSSPPPPVVMPPIRPQRGGGSTPVIPGPVRRP